MSKQFNWAAARLAAAFALALCFATPLVSWADAITAVNPVTGDTETYTYKFTGTDTWNGVEYWQDSNGDHPSAVPAKSGDNIWDPILFDGNTINIAASMSVEGWNLRLGLYNGANVRLNSFVKWQGDTNMWVTVDGTSKFTVGAFAKGNIADGKVIKCSTTRANGIEWLVNLESTGNANNTFEYYLAGEGSVSYQGVTAANHKIKQADVALSGNEKSVQSKTLVSFTSTDKTFTADAAIKIKDGDNVLRTVYLTSVTAGATTLTTAADVGTCELVQTSTGIDLYWVDGDPNDLPAAAVYKPSININFTSGTALSTGADVGIGGYAIPGTSWNNLIGNNGSLATIKGVDSTGEASTISGAKVTISGTRGYWSNGSVQAESDLRQGYIDDNANNASPQFVVEGIPYDRYKVILYFSNNDADVKFGYVTVNGLNYKGDLANTTTVASSGGSETWGASSVSAYTEGGNYLVIPTQLNGDGTLTVVSHRLTGCRAGLAAVQIVEDEPDMSGENNMEIPVSGDTVYTVSEAKTLTGTVYLTGSGTLTLDGSAKITAATIDVAKDVVLNINADRLDATTFTGLGTVVYDGSQPVIGKGWTDSDNWKGTVWVKNIGSAPAGETANTAVTLGSDTTTAADNAINSWGNANSYVKFTNVRGHVAAANCPWTLVLEDGADTYAWYNNNGWTGRQITIGGLKGYGTFYDAGNKKCRQNLVFTDATAFTGSIHVEGKRIGLGGTPTVSGDSETLAGVIEVVSGATATLASGKTWYAGYRIAVNGTLTDNGILDGGNTSAAISGSGTVVFGGVPSPAGDKWWKNAAWTGTVEIKGVSALNGDYVFNDYGNSGSTLKLTNCSGWLKPNYTCVPALEIGGVFTWNDGSSGLNNTFKVATLKGSGTISIPNQGAPTAVWQITDDWSGFTGPVVGNNGAAQRILVFGSTLPITVTAGDIYISEGATLDLDNSSGAWWGVGMRFVVDGTVKASARNKWGGGTGMVLGDTGVLELVSSSNTNDEDTNMSGITGTGTLKFSSSAGWRAFPKTDANMPATTLTIQTELADSLILPTKTNDVTVIGNLAGSKNIRSDWANNGSDGRILTVTQSKDTEWQGKFVSNRITKFNVVAPAEGTSGTLTLSGAQEATIPMQIDGAVNLTGTWVGATTVAGTFGGTGTLTGNLTFSDGATLKANASALTVSGTVTLPTVEGETLTIDATALEDDEVTILSSSSITTETDVSKVTVNGLYTVVPEAGALKLVSIGVEVTVPTIPNTTVTVAVGGETIGTDPGTYKVAPDSVVTVTYAAAPGYEISGTTEYTIDTSKSETTFDPSETTHVAQYVASITTGELVVKYTTLQAAVTDAAAINNGKILLLASADGMVAAIPAPASGGRVQFYIAANGNAEGTINAPAGDYIMTTASETIPIGNADYDATKYTVTEAAVAVTVGESRSLYGASYINDAVSAAIAGGLGSTIEFVNGTDSTPYVSTLEASGFTVENNVWTFTTLPVARVTHGVTEISYLTLAAAFANVQDGDTITVLTNNTLTGETSVTNNNLTLDLNGFTVTGATGDNPMFNLGAVSFTITDTSEGKTGKAVSAGSKVILSGSACTITLTSGTLESGDVPVYLYDNLNSVLNINGGKIVCNKTSGYAVSILNGTVNMTAGEVNSTCSGFYMHNATVSGGTIKIGSGSSWKVFYDHDNWTTTTVTGGTFNRDVSNYCAAGYAAFEDTPGFWTVREVYAEGQEVRLYGTNVTITASQATWLKACGDKATVSNKIENLTFDQFYNDYLLNLDILASENDYTFAVKGIAVGEDTVDVTVTLTRTGALTENEKAKPIVGTLKLKGTASLGTAFTVLGEASVEFDANAKFGDGATETTVTVDTTETDAKFFQPVIE